MPDPFTPLAAGVCAGLASWAWSWWESRRWRKREGRRLRARIRDLDDLVAQLEADVDALRGPVPDATRTLTPEELAEWVKGRGLPF